MPRVVRVSLFCPDPARRRRIEALLICGGLAVVAEDALDVELVLCVLGPHSPERTAGYVAQLRSSDSSRKFLFLSDQPMPSKDADGLLGSDEEVITDIWNPATLVPRIRDHVIARNQIEPEIAELVGASPAMRAVRDQIKLVAPSEATVLITGETGTGKECAARMVHRLSKRARGPFIAVNCAAIPNELLEGELFGYERGAFTGAIRAYPGKLKIAERGTLVLDEVGDLSLAGQAKILRAIESRELYRLGATSPERFDARIVAATNVELAARMEANFFRKDLYFRLAVACIHLPPLRERREDIGPLAQHFLQKLARASHRVVDGFDSEAIETLSDHVWIGNARELRNVIEIALISSRGSIVKAGDLPAIPTNSSRAVRDSGGLPANDRDKLLHTLAACGGNKSMAAKSLKWSRMTLYRKLERYGLEPLKSVTPYVTM
jgi:transcriptional regulator with PAS, ATPase and Fis domain